MLVVGSEAIFGAVSFAGGVTAVTSLGSDIVDMNMVAFGAIVFDAIITVFTAAIFASDLDMFLCHFFLLLHLPCPGPGMLTVETEK
jgi:hypothetical protein